MNPVLKLLKRLCSSGVAILHNKHEADKQFHIVMRANLDEFLDQFSGSEIANMIYRGSFTPYFEFFKIIEEVDGLALVSSNAVHDLIDLEGLSLLVTSEDLTGAVFNFEYPSHVRRVFKKKYKPRNS